MIKIIEDIKEILRNDGLMFSENQRILTAKILVNQIRSNGIYDNIQDTEFKVFSQFGDDGIIQYLINNVNILDKEKRFVEFGVENYLESNTRFLLLNDNWAGFVMDGNPANINHIINDKNYWKYSLMAECKFITAENINEILKRVGFEKDLGLMHIDIDGNDYWVWKALEKVMPVVIVAEYNSILGIDRSITVPYDPKFNKTKAHFSNLYWGASLRAYYNLFISRGYSFVGTDSAGNNAYFIRSDRLRKVKKKSLKEGYTESRFRESRDKSGRLTFINGSDRLGIIEKMIVLDLQTGRKTKIKHLLS